MESHASLVLFREFRNRVQKEILQSEKFYSSPQFDLRDKTSFSEALAETQGYLAGAVKELALLVSKTANYLNSSASATLKEIQTQELELRTLLLV
jgi:hypothetical protein